jgi:hypothetical protein
MEHTKLWISTVILIKMQNFVPMKWITGLEYIDYTSEHDAKIDFPICNCPHDQIIDEQPHNRNFELHEPQS